MTVASDTAPAPRLWAPLRVPAYRYLFAGQATSLLGDQLLVVALPFLLLGRGVDAAGLGGVFAAYGAARVVALPIGGWLGDRYARRLVMMASDVVRALLVLGLLVVSGPGWAGPGTVAVLMAGVGLAEGAFLPAGYAILPSTVPAELLGRANGLSSAAQNFAVLAGPGLGGLLAATLDPRVCLALDAATFAVSIATLALLRTRPAEPEPQAGAASALRVLASHRLLRVMVILTLVSNLAYYGMLEVALPVLSADVLHTAVFGFGASLAAFGLGSLLGSLAIALLERQSHRGLIACGIGAVQGVLFAAVATQSGLPGTVVLLALAGLTCGILNVFYLSRLQQSIPDALLGRAMGLLMVGVFAVHPASVAMAGTLARATGPGTVFVLAGACITVAFAAGAMTRSYRNL
jgi:MFS family permease